MTAELAPAAQKSALVVRDRPIDLPHGNVAAQDCPRVFLQPLQHRLRDGSDRRDRGDAQRQRGQEDTKPANPAAQLTPRQFERQAPVAGRTRRHASVPAATTERAPGSTTPLTMRPSDRRTTPVAAPGDGVVMGDQHQRRAVLLLQREQDVDDDGAGVAVQVARRLVGQQQPRPHHEGAGEGDALLLTARKLRRIVLQPVAQTDRFQALGRAVEGVPAAGELERHGDVLQRVHRRHQVERLEDDADGIAPETKRARPRRARRRRGRRCARRRWSPAPGRRSPSSWSTCRNPTGRRRRPSRRCRSSGQARAEC